VLQVAVSGGSIKVVDVPEPGLRPGCVRVRTSHSLISAGTESANVGGGGGENIVVRAIKNPQLVRKVMDRVSSHGLKSTMDLVRSKLASDSPLGYASAGVVDAVAPDVTGFAVGDRVACAGAGYANHAASNVVPKHLVTKLPDHVSFEEGAFATLAAIALQGVRRAAPTLGERIVVVGLGLLGQITVQLLKASGAVTIGVDVRADRVARARTLGLDDGFAAADRDFVAGIVERTGGHGADAVIVTAGGGDAGLLNLSFEACRRKGRVVLVGDVPIRIQRDKIYKKELDFFISTSYGPGRYDPAYEERGADYPFGYVRWTEGRNLEEVVRLMGTGVLRVKPLVDAVHPIADAPTAYQSLAGPARPIGILLDYGLDTARPISRQYRPAPGAGAHAATGARVGVIGYGSYFQSVLLPLLKADARFSLVSVCTRNGLTVRNAVEKKEFARGTTEYQELVADPEIDVVYIATRHNEHYAMSKSAIEAGKAVFVEKPMTVSAADGRALADLVRERGGFLTVGFNRRFSPHAQRLAELLRPIAAPKTLVYRVNAGALPPDHWLLDPVEGGGRLVGEGVHFFDFLSFLAGAPPTSVSASAVAGRSRDEAIVTLGFADGSVGTLIYTGGGAGAAGKERVEVFAGGAAFVLDDYKSLQAFGVKGAGTTTKTIEKGQKEQLENVALALAGKAPLGVTAEDGYWATWCAERAIGGTPLEDAASRVASAGESRPGLQESGAGAPPARA
jgi:predicted dehydrogenase/threonine dehydrogenase-like Zn-dependent dehydrogenase